MRWLNVGKPLRQAEQARPEGAALKDVRGGKTHTHDAMKNRISATSAATGVRRGGMFAQVTAVRVISWRQNAADR